MFLSLSLGAEAFAHGTPTKNPLDGKREAIRNGGVMFRNRCAGCHGPDARGYNGPDLTGLSAAGATDDRLFATVRRGVAPWHFQTGSPIFAAPITYMQDGRQYELIGAGTTLTAFALPEGS